MILFHLENMMIP